MKISRLVHKLFLVAILVISLNGCAISYITERVSLTDKFKTFKSNVLNSGELSYETMQELRILSLQAKFNKEPSETLLELETSNIPGRETEQAWALAELAFYHAENLFDDGDKLLAGKFYLMSAAHAFDFLFHYKEALTHSYVSPHGRNMAELYNASLSKLLSIHQTEKTNWRLPLSVQVANTTYNFSASNEIVEELANYKLDQLFPAYETSIRGLENFYKSEGIGAPVVRKINNKPESKNFNPFFPKVLSLPLTIFLDFSAKGEKDNQFVREVKVKFIDPYKINTIKVNDKEFPIEADFSTSFGAMLSDLKPGSLDLDQLLNPSKYIKKIGLKFIQPYDPDKIPVVLVHGLYSSPATFIQMANDLMGIEKIRNRYQFWVFGYPTGLPILNSSTALRRSLLEAEKLFNPDGKNENFNKMVLVGHSMGGILSRSMMLESSKPLYDAFVTAPIDQLDLTSKEYKLLHESLLFEPLPFVDRMVLIASPLRGSAVAQGSIVKQLTRWFISLPKAVVTSRTSIIAKNEQYLNPSLNNSDFINSANSSVDNLRTDSPLLKAYINTPTVAGVPYHTIIGIRDGDPNFPKETSDGIVEYFSSHLDQANSEKLVPAGHSCLSHPQTITEVRRILLLHLDEIEQPAANEH